MLPQLIALFLSRMPRKEEGQDAAEYALLIGLIALVIVAAVIVLGTNLSTLFQTIANTVATWPI